MTVEAMQAFRELAGRDEAVETTVRGAVGPDGNADLASVVKLGAEHGFQFSEADVISVFSNDNEELSDFELELVSAGTLAVCKADKV